MTKDQAGYIADIFQKLGRGEKMTTRERENLQGLLNNMDAAEQCGIAAAMIKILLGA